MVKLYKRAQTNESITKPQENFLELNENLTPSLPQYVQEPPLLESNAIIYVVVDHNLDDQPYYIVDNGTSHSVLRDKEYFKKIIPSSRTMTMITGQDYICLYRIGPRRSHYHTIEGDGYPYKIFNLCTHNNQKPY